MAEILLSTLADALGGPVVADATFTATATRARAVGDGVVANKTITVSVVQGVPSEPILLDQSGVDWCWRVRVVFPSIGVRIDRTVAVPDVPSVEWADLVDVDPATLLPAESAVPAWTAAVGQVAGLLADTVVARDAATTAQGLSEDARDAAVLARGIAEGARDGAVVARGASEAARDQAQVYAANTVELQDTAFTALIADPVSATRTQLNATMGAYLDVNVPGEVSGALPPAISAVLPGAVTTEVTTQVTPHVNAAAGSATAAQTARTGAEAARDLALAGQFAGAAIVAGTDLNTLTTPGVYRQGTPANATLPLNYPLAAQQGVLEVFHSTSATSIFQRYMVTTGAASGKGHWQRRFTSSAWSAWSFVATQRIDQTAGRAIYTWDHVNNREQLIYGDTGLRDITSLVLNGWSAGLIYIFREGSRVTLACNVLNPAAQTAPAFIDIPPGFSPASGMLSRGVLHTLDSPAAVRNTVLISNQLRVEGSLLASALYGSVTWRTNESWPSSLPGTPVGSIPS